MSDSLKRTVTTVKGWINKIKWKQIRELGTFIIAVIGCLMGFYNRADGQSIRMENAENLRISNYFQPLVVDVCFDEENEDSCDILVADEDAQEEYKYKPIFINNLRGAPVRYHFLLTGHGGGRVLQQTRGAAPGYTSLSNADIAYCIEALSVPGGCRFGSIPYRFTSCYLFIEDFNDNAALYMVCFWLNTETRTVVKADIYDKSVLLYQNAEMIAIAGTAYDVVQGVEYSEGEVVAVTRFDNEEESSYCDRCYAILLANEINNYRKLYDEIAELYR